jgi:hypothetical protein
VAIEPQLSKQMAQTMYRASASTVSNTGQITYAAAASFTARVEEEYREVQTPVGTLQRTTHRIYTTTALLAGQRVWLPGVSSSDATLAREVLEVHTITDELGAVHHYEAVV